MEDVEVGGKQLVYIILAVSGLFRSFSKTLLHAHVLVRKLLSAEGSEPCDRLQSVRRLTQRR